MEMAHRYEEMEQNMKENEKMIFLMVKKKKANYFCSIKKKVQEN